MSANVVVPEVGESIVDARVGEWLKKEGDVVKAGDALVELETDKIDLEVAAPEAGVLGKITQGDGADVKVGDVIGVIEDSSASAANPRADSASDKAPADESVDKGAKREPPKIEEAKAQSSEAERTRATPAARNAAQQNDVDLKQVRGSGEAGRA